ncbi:hypothetical protein L5515_007717 [Caenorhabditis briggsae]|uniref:Uncharacterized protein n=1 Tax=Caenorhabditis briggsae TaxID=6238 RepID=A0AAE9JJV6_CAEBR|nr:hypothetical protein L5515_007717 [Caenorhabditis briggsae]
MMRLAVENPPVHRAVDGVVNRDIEPLYHPFAYCTTHYSIVPHIRSLYHSFGHCTTHSPLYHPLAIVPL